MTWPKPFWEAVRALSLPGAPAMYVADPDAHDAQGWPHNSNRKYTRWRWNSGTRSAISYAHGFCVFHVQTPIWGGHQMVHSYRLWTWEPADPDAEGVAATHGKWTEHTFVPDRLKAVASLAELL